MLSIFFSGVTLLTFIGLLGLLCQALGLSKALPRILALALWISFLGVLAELGWFAQWQSRPPHLLLAPLGALVMFTLVFRGQWQKIPVVGLVGLQSFRLLVELFLHAGGEDGLVPPQLTYSGWNFDILVGLSAPVMAWGAYRGYWGRRSLLLWNALGMILLLNVVTWSLLSAPGPLHLLLDYPPNTFVAQTPFIWLPGFLAPLAAVLHVLAFAQLGPISSPGRRQPLAAF